MILWNPRTGECDEVPKAAAYAMGGAFFAAAKDIDAGGAKGLRTATRLGRRSRVGESQT